MKNNANAAAYTRGAAPAEPRISSLDSLRGIAALAVVLNHALIALPSFWAAYSGEISTGWQSAVAYSPLRLLWAGYEAVTIFFVLSGFVLSIPFWDGRNVKYTSFAVRRIVRLYPPYIVSVAFALVAFVLLRSQIVGGSAWTQLFWHGEVSFATIADHVLMLTSAEHNLFNPVIWSLVVEMHISIAFPILITFMAAARLLAVPAAVGVAGVVYLLGVHNTPPYGPTLYYAWVFLLGAELARHREMIRKAIQRLSGPAQWVLIALALCLLDIRWLLGGAPEVLAKVMVPAGAAIVVAACAYSDRLVPLLEHRALVWLGRVSYSLYLVHFVVLFSLLHSVGPLWALILVVPLSLAAAEVLYRLVESPSIRASRALAIRKPSGQGHPARQDR